MLKLIQVEKRYKKNKVLQEISLDFSPPGLYILQGVNGSGKSTLIKILAGVIFKSGGEIKKEFSISYLPDKFLFPKLMRVDGYIAKVFSLYKIKEKSLNWLKEYQIPKKRIGELSKGNLQKLGLLQILSHPADCYILDEPLDGLDDFAKRLVKKKVMEKLQEHKTIILSLHNKSLFQELHPKIIEIRNGFCYEKKKKI